MPRKFQGIVVVVACLLDWTPAGAAALDHVSRPLDPNADFVERVAAKRGCPWKDGCGASSAVRQADDVGSFVKSQPLGQWTGTERDLVAGSKQAPPTAITPEAAKVHVDKIAPLLEKQGFKVIRYPGLLPMVHVTAPAR
jgi:hypothetical protein